MNDSQCYSVNNTSPASARKNNVSVMKTTNVG